MLDVEVIVGKHWYHLSVVTTRMKIFMTSHSVLSFEPQPKIYSHQTHQTYNEVMNYRMIIDPYYWCFYDTWTPIMRNDLYRAHSYSDLIQTWGKQIESKNHIMMAKSFTSYTNLSYNSTWRNRKGAYWESYY